MMSTEYINDEQWLLSVSVVTDGCGCVLQSLILQIAAQWLEQEKKDIVEAKDNYMSETCPAPDLSGDQAALMVPSLANAWLAC